MEKLLTAAEVAEALGLSLSTVTRLCQRGELQHKKVGVQLRFRQRWVDDYIDEQNGSDRVSKRLLESQKVLGPARKFPALHGGRKRA